MTKLLPVFLSILLLSWGCATNPVTGRQNFVLMSEAQELQLGQSYHKKILSEYALYPDEKLQAYISEIGHRLVANSHRANIGYKFFLLDSPEVNAFALPGGYVYITRGILAYMNSEAELAGVLGHEIGHITARHGVRQQSKGMLVDLFGSVAAVASGNSSVGNLSDIFGSALMSGYGRKHELEADRLGAVYLVNSGYSPWAMRDVIGTLKNQELFEIERARAEGRRPKVYHGVFASHPDNDKRLLGVIRAAGRGEPQPTGKPVDNNFLKRLDSLSFGASEAQGVVKGNRFMHKLLDVFIDFPQNWQVENQPERLIAVSNKRDAVIQVGLDEVDEATPTADYLKTQFPNVRNIRPYRGVSVAGHIGISTVNSPFGSRPARVAALRYKN